MVVFVDLDDACLPEAPDALLHGFNKPMSISDQIIPDLHDYSAPAQNPSLNVFSAALSCYPYEKHLLGPVIHILVVKAIARSVDLNTLHSLSRTCRQFHANLTPYRHQLAKQSLRCENEYIETLADLLRSGAAIPDSIKSVIQLLSQGSAESGRLTRGKVGKCARDMVAECRRCSRVVCRNCTIKPPTNTMLKNRIRRLCTTCRTVPISQHQIPPQHFRTHLQEPIPLSFTAPAFLRTPCTCEDAVWLCHQCGYTLRNNDVIYRRVWGWRTRYSTSLDGLGTGIGEGSQGVKCGRGEDCLAAQEIELEVVSEADDDGPLSGSIGSSTNHTPASNPDDGEPGYFRQEIVGIGGRFKQKVKKRVTVGACVVEHEDERETGRYLTREEEGKHRSWCGWCWRVIPARCEG